jgi:hypothetical protein
MSFGNLYQIELQVMHKQRGIALGADGKNTFDSLDRSWV